MTPCSVSGCIKVAKKRGWCDMHYNRWIRHGTPGGAAPLPNRPPFWAKVDRGAADQCWPWQANRDEKGYGIFANRGAHRKAYELAVGPIPEGLELDHLCRNRACVNPAHLEPVSRRTNLARSTNPARFGILFNTCMRGHEFTPENTYVAPSRPKARRCRICMREQGKTAYQKKKAGRAVASATLPSPGTQAAT